MGHGGGAGAGGAAEVVRHASVVYPRPPWLWASGTGISMREFVNKTDGRIFREKEEE